MKLLWSSRTQKFSDDTIIHKEFTTSCDVYSITAVRRTYVQILMLLVHITQVDPIPDAMLNGCHVQIPKV